MTKKEKVMIVELFKHNRPKEHQRDFDVWACMVSEYVYQMGKLDKTFDKELFLYEVNK